MTLTFQLNSWCCSFCTKGKLKYKAFLHSVLRPATSLSPQSGPALDPEPYCHASTILISSEFFPLQWTEFESKSISHPLSNIFFESLEKANKEVRLDSSSSPKTLSYQRPAMINSLLGNHSWREPNTCNHRIQMQEGCWDSHWALAQHLKLQVFQWITTPHLKVFFFFEWQKQNSMTKNHKTLCQR